jgi:hypothetical protein
MKTLNSILGAGLVLAGSAFAAETNEVANTNTVYGAIGVQAAPAVTNAPVVFVSPLSGYAGKSNVSATNLTPGVNYRLLHTSDLNKPWSDTFQIYTSESLTNAVLKTITERDSSFKKKAFYRIITP